MTIFGWDASHFDGIITLATAKKAKAEGIVFATAKVSESTNYDDPLDGTNLANFRDAGIKILGGYHVVRSGGTAAAQVKYCIEMADKSEPWWRDFEGWFWQVDLELWGYDNVSAARGIDFGRQLKAATGRQVIMYASKGQYGDRLIAWKPEPLWNANYPSSRRAPFKDLYPGDDFHGWDKYSDQVPSLLQYASTATIGGLTTCDANAYRGTFDELFELINPGANMGQPITTDNIHTQVWNHPDIPAPKNATDQDKVSAGTALQDARDTAYRIETAVAGLKTPESGLTADDIRQIVREEVGKALNKTSSMFTLNYADGTSTVLPG